MAQVRVAAGPHGILGTGFPGFAQGIQGFRLFFSGRSSYARRVVENRGFVRAQGDSQVEFAQGVFLPSQSGVIGAQQDAGAGVFGHLFQVVFERDANLWVMLSLASSFPMAPREFRMGT